MTGDDESAVLSLAAVEQRATAKREAQAAITESKSARKGKDWSTGGHAFLPTANR